MIKFETLTQKIMRSGYTIDLSLLKKFQSLSDKLQTSFGYNNFVIAKILRMAMIIVFCAREIMAFMQGIDAGELIILACSVVVIMKMELMLNSAQKSVHEDKELMNSTVINYATTRIIIQFVSIAAFGFLLAHLYNTASSFTAFQKLNEWKEICWDVFGILLFFVAYFNSCTPKPYKPGNAKNMINNSKATQRSLAFAVKK